MKTTKSPLSFAMPILPNGGTGQPLHFGKGIFIMEEIWKDIIGYEGEYLVSNTGKIKSVKKIGKQIILLPSISPWGYKIVSLCKLGTIKTTRVHREVAKAFVPNPDNKPHVNHLNLIKTDNRAENLEWCTPQENVAHATKNGRVGGLELNRKDLSIEVYQFDMNGKLISKYPSLKEAERKTGVNHIAKCANGGCYRKNKKGKYFSKMTSAGGYKWSLSPFLTDTKDK